MNESLIDETDLTNEMQSLLAPRDAFDTQSDPRTLDEYQQSSACQVASANVETEAEHWNMIGSDEIAVIKACDYESLSKMQEAYERMARPAICFATLEQASLIVEWIKPNDDIAIVGEAESLTQWRLERVAAARSQKLDPLTKILTRKELLASLTPLCEQASDNQPVSLILFDVDNFKSFNDNYGFSLGDQLLRVIADQVKWLCCGTTVARSRGGEFAIVVRGDEGVAKRVAELVHSRINTRLLNSDELSEGTEIGASFGVASAKTSCQPTYLLARTDEAVFSAKANGRNQVICYSEITTISNRHHEDREVVSMENKARVLSERMTNYVTQQSKRIVSTLRKEANTDALTQLSNRRCLDRYLEDQFELALEKEQLLCVALIDLDHFGKVNKEHGWPTGDKVLQEISASIEDTIRGSDFVGRYGGEEICLVMPMTSLDSAEAVCERIRHNVAMTCFETTKQVPLTVTLSIGLVELVHDDDEAVGQLMEKVSKLTLLAKERGRNQVRSMVDFETDSCCSN